MFQYEFDVCFLVLLVQRTDVPHVFITPGPCDTSQDLLEQWRYSPQHMTWILSQMAKKKLLEKCQQVLKRVQTQGLEASMLGLGGSCWGIKVKTPEDVGFRVLFRDSF